MKVARSKIIGSMKTNNNEGISIKDLNDYCNNVTISDQNEVIKNEEDKTPSSFMINNVKDSEYNRESKNNLVSKIAV